MKTNAKPVAVQTFGRLLAELRDILQCIKNGEISEARITLERLIQRIEREEEK